PLVCTPTADSSTLDVATITTALNAGTSVTVTTSNGAGTQAGNITLDAALSLAAKGAAQSETLTLLAGAGGGAGAITINQPISDNTNNSLSLVLTAGGGIAFNTPVSLQGTLTATAGTNAAGNITQASGV